MRYLTRRNALIGLAAVTATASFDALAIEPRWLEVSRHRVPIAGLPAALDGFAIAQITDAHLTKIGAVEEALIETIRQAGSQLVVLTGDLVDHERDLAVLAELCSALTETGARVIACLGNWEHWGQLSVPRLRDSYARTGASLVIDDWFDWDSGLAIYATDDATGGRPRQCPAARRRPVELLLTHSPAFVDQSTPRRFDLALAGHTHGGQIRAGRLAPVTPPGSGRFVAGWYETPMGSLYVSRGTGTSLVPARFCCRPELALFELVQA